MSDRKRISFSEALDDYDNKVNRAVEQMLGIDDVEATRLLDQIPLDQFLNMTIAIDKGDRDLAMNTLMKYAKKAPSVESVTKRIKNLIAEKKRFVVVPALQLFSSKDQVRVLEGMQNAELQKIMANLRGYTTPGLYEGEIFDMIMQEEIMKMLKEVSLSDMAEAIGGRPGEQQSTVAYGSGDEEEIPSPGNSGNGDETATFTNDSGEKEQGEVVAKDSQAMTIKTKKGTKRIPMDQAMLDEENEIRQLKSNIIKLSNRGR